MVRRCCLIGADGNSALAATAADGASGGNGTPSGAEPTAGAPAVAVPAVRAPAGVGDRRALSPRWRPVALAADQRAGAVACDPSTGIPNQATREGAASCFPSPPSATATSTSSSP